MPSRLSTALDLHRAGQLSAAAHLYQQILSAEADNPEALHLLGVLRQQQGDSARAVELIGRAVALEPSVPAFHANLAEAYRTQGQLERAAGCCRTALQLFPDYPEALHNLGIVLHGLGRPAEAIESLRRALELEPAFAAAHNALGMSLREIGDVDEALAHFRQAVALQADYAPARTNLGLMLLDRDQKEEALAHCQEAARLQPNVAAMHHNLGNALRLLERPVDARAAYLEALRLDPNLSRSQAHLGLVLQKEGKLDDALPWLKRAAELEPENADFWTWLADLHDQREDNLEALRAWEKVVSLAPDRAEAHGALGWALQEEGRLREAEEQFLVAQKLDPQAGGPHVSLGGLHEERGELDRAEAAFREALRVQPSFPIPYARLATLLRGKLPEADRAALEQRLADQELAPVTRARLMFGLAHVLDAYGDFAQAAEFSRQANALALEQAKGRRDYDPARHEDFVGKLLQAFDSTFFERSAGNGYDSRRPVFVFGLPRSGTTLVEQILSSHPRVFAAGELTLARRSFNSIPAMMGESAPPIECVNRLQADTLRRLAEQHEGWLKEYMMGKPPTNVGGSPQNGGSLQDAGSPQEWAPAPGRIVDKMPDNYMYLGLLASMFPRAAFIHCRRDLRDVAVSCWMTDFRSIRWANDPVHIAGRIRQYQRLMDHWRSVLPIPMCEVNYEDTVADLEKVARRLLAECGLEWDPACLEFYRSKRNVRTASVTQVRQPIYRQSVARWKNYEGELGELFAALPATG